MAVNEAPGGARSALKSVSRVFLSLPILTLATLLISLIIGVPIGTQLRQEAVTVSAVSMEHLRSHKGWSFPAKVWSKPIPLEGLELPLLIEQAEHRSYIQQCPPTSLGSYCPKTGDVILRGGLFPEGRQPPGNHGWTRPLALEPVLVGSLVGKDKEIRSWVHLEEVPGHLISAMMTQYDPEFKEHAGIPLRRYYKKTLNDSGGLHPSLTLLAWRFLSGTRASGLIDELREQGLALALDRFLGKETILEVMLNAPVMSQYQAYPVAGVRETAHYLWGLEPEELNLAQSATLVALMMAPGRYSPKDEPELLIRQRNRILKKMVEQGWDVTDSLEEPLNLQLTPPLIDGEFPDYMRLVRKQLKRDLEIEKGLGRRYNVFTSLDPLLQRKLRASMEVQMDALNSYMELPEPIEAAVAVIDQTTGQLSALYPGRNPRGFDRVTRGRRTSAGALQPLLMTLAFEEINLKEDLLYSPNTLLPNSYDTPVSLGQWRPRNFEEIYPVQVTLAAAFAWSQNIATSVLMDRVGGPRAMRDIMKRFNIHLSKEQVPEPGLSLGQTVATPFQLASMVGTLASGGMRAQGETVLSVLTHKDERVFKQELYAERITTPEASRMAMELMRISASDGLAQTARGFRGRPGIEGDFVGKGGVSNDNLDFWYVGSNGHYSTALWLGLDQPDTLEHERPLLTTETLTAPMWGWMMRRISEGHAPSDRLMLPLDYYQLSPYTGLNVPEGCLTMVMGFPQQSRPLMERKGPCPKMERLMPRPDPRQLWGKILDQRFPVDPLPIRSRIIVKPTEVPL